MQVDALAFNSSVHVLLIVRVWNVEIHTAEMKKIRYHCLRLHHSEKGRKTQCQQNLQPGKAF